MSIEEFINLPIISEETFNAIDRLEHKEILNHLWVLFRNKDGFLTKGEIKLTNKNASMSEVLEVSGEGIDKTDDKLTYYRW